MGSIAIALRNGRDVSLMEPHQDVAHGGRLGCTVTLSKKVLAHVQYKVSLKDLV